MSEKGLWAWYRLTTEERKQIHTQYHLNKINEALTNLHGHYGPVPNLCLNETSALAHPSLEVARADIMYDITVLLNTLKKYLQGVGRSDEEREQLIKLKETLEELI
jgi:hypothetical protein